MSLDKIITNDPGAFRNPGTSFTTFKDGDGNYIDFPTDVIAGIPCAAAINIGTVVTLDAASISATVPLRWRAWLGASDPLNTAIGVIQETVTAAKVAAGYRSARVVIRGFCVVDATALTPAAGNYGFLANTSNLMQPGSAEFAATVVPGAGTGIYLAVKDATSQLAPFWLQRV